MKLLLSACFFLIYSLVSWSQDDDYIVVDAIYVDGNQKTKESFILRIIDLQVGDTIHRSELEDHQTQIRKDLINTDLFYSVGTLPLEDDTGKLELNIIVKEHWFLWPIPYARIHETNFNTWLKQPDLFRLSYGLDLSHKNLAGRGIELGVFGRGGYVQAGGLRFKIPYLGKTQLAVEFEANFQEHVELVYGTLDNERLFYRNQDDRKVGQEWQINTALKYQLSANNHIGFRTAFIDFSVQDSLQELNSFFPTNAEDKIWRNAVFVRFDQRDYRPYPREGWFVHAEIEHSIFNSDKSTYLRPYIDLRSYQKLSNNWYSGVGMKWRSTPNNSPYYLVQSLGYHDLIRSFEDFVLDGRSTFLIKTNVKRLLFSNEIRANWVPIDDLRRIPLSIFATAFVDLGYVWKNENNFSNSLQDQWLNGFGLGLDFTSIYGKVLRLEMSYNSINHLGWYLHFTQPI